MITTKEDLGFKSSADRLEDEQKTREEMVRDRLWFGIPYLDRVLRGIFKHDFVLIGAKTGAGKSELVSKIAAFNAFKGVPVYGFFLEAEPNEIERRIRFSELTKAYYKAGGVRPMNFLYWVEGIYNEDLAPYEDQVKEKMQGLKTLYTYYRTGNFGLKEFEERFNFVQGDAGLVITDHVNFFDIEGMNENLEVTNIMKRIRDLTLIHGVPTVAVAHLRKLSRMDKILVPTIEDFMGTSNLGKIVTKALIAAPGGPASNPDHAITYFRTAKFRMFGAATSCVGATVFDTTTNEYLPDYKTGYLIKDDTEFKEYDEEEIPSWLKEDL